MEMYKNFTDKPYLIMIGILAAAWAFVIMADSFFSVSIFGRGIINSMVILTTVFAAIATTVFVFVYPFHLLRVDYRHKVMSLMIASGVPRVGYYFAKIGATVISCLIAAIVILVVPLLNYMVFEVNDFVVFMRMFHQDFFATDSILFLLSSATLFVASVVMLSTAIIMTRGKMTAIFLFMGFFFLTSIVRAIFDVPLLWGSRMWFRDFNTMMIQSIIVSLIQMAVFACIGISVLRKQDL